MSAFCASSVFTCYLLLLLLRTLHCSAESTINSTAPRRRLRQLSVNYYATSCRQLDQLVASVTAQQFKEAPVSGPATIRLFFHDCFGCDGSILISSRPGSKEMAERDAQDNKDLATEAFDVVNKAKALVESKCPGVVSCADILAIAARDFVHLVCFVEEAGHSVRPWCLMRSQMAKGLVQRIASSACNGREVEELGISISLNDLAMSGFIPPYCFFPLQFLIQSYLEMQFFFQISTSGALCLDFVNSFIEDSNFGLDMPKMSLIPRGPYYQVKKGRWDGKISMASRVYSNLPHANSTIAELLNLFSSKGLTPDDLVVLSGAHTIGFAHCKHFVSRLYDYRGTRQPDPAIDSRLLKALKMSCPSFGGNDNVVAPFDVTTPFSFDNAYYQNLESKLGLLASDQALSLDTRTKPLVQALAKDKQKFFQTFSLAMDKMGSIGVKRGPKHGERRKDCSTHMS
ncbi:hypothetical protein RJ639_010019 [Escallonia herrerae]|uniref:peroxidase n=1 Tax=Escallonia herrerae TaxID=1293975 RepID=A0AA88VU96_9ASTE|nr:hypothetical protein RJ639_010019 [Escallonia herrerae]